MFDLLSGHDLINLLATYGYLAVLLLVALESMGIPLPGETMLITAAMYAGTTHHLQVAFIIGAAATGAILGDNLRYLIGREGGYRLLHRYGKYVRLNERKLKVGEYLFRRHGGKVVFFGRFIALLRIWAAFLAGTNRMPWQRFLLFNAAGGFLWASAYGILGYTLGHTMAGFGRTVAMTGIGAAALVAVGISFLVRRKEHQLAEEAEQSGYAAAA